MRDVFINYDQWLERPYQNMMEESDKFVDWCDAHDWDPDDPNADEAYGNWVESEYEALAEAQHEAYLDRMEYEAHEIDDYLDW